MTTNLTRSVVKAIYWFSDSGINVGQIDSSLFTHIFCAFADLDKNSNQVTISRVNAPIFSSFTSILQRRNPSVSTLLSIGGGASRKEDFSAMAKQSSSRQTFISSSIQLARANNFHGLDLDWEYPEGTNDIENYATLLTEFRAAVKADASTSKKPHLLLTAAVYYSAVRKQDIFPIKSIRTNLDWINVMSYDYYSPTWRKDSTYAPAPLYSETKDGIEKWISMDLPAEKIVLGLPFYGRAWKLVDPNVNGIGAPANGKASPGNGINDDGSITYTRIIGNSFIQPNRENTHYDSTLVTNYCYAGTTWIGYDDVESIKDKVLFAKTKFLRGYFAWSVGGDHDFNLSKAAYAAWM